MSKASNSALRQKIATEAASLLYFGSEKEYRQAKLKAAKNFGARVLPSNLEIALALDNIAESNEGSARNERLFQMRNEALKIMKILEKYSPSLIGSVWRGTIRRGSDIDIEVFHDNPQKIIALLKSDIEIIKAEEIKAVESSKLETSFHIYAYSKCRFPVEIVVRNLEYINRRRKCDTFGDVIKGLRNAELEKLLSENPTKKFLPS